MSHSREVAGGSCALMIIQILVSCINAFGKRITEQTTKTTRKNGGYGYNPAKIIRKDKPDYKSGKYVHNPNDSQGCG